MQYIINQLKFTSMKTLELLLKKLNDYPITQNERPIWVISSDKNTLFYYRMWYHKNPELSLSIEDAMTCKTTSELQEKMGV
ncbi:MAG: hypothetical protein RBU23_13290 [Candidatus Auribacterota bacterium]|jgi:hypothetical protein|nr:hypothetical protein [Candidatus Auribacterota bacterium]